METKEVIDNLEFLIGEDCTDTQHDYIEEIKYAIKALRKQNPKKPRFDFNMSNTLSRYHCPCCGKLIKVKHDSGTLDNNDAPNYCKECGQRLDFGE